MAVICTCKLPRPVQNRVESDKIEGGLEVWRARIGTHQGKKGVAAWAGGWAGLCFVITLHSVADRQFM